MNRREVLSAGASALLSGLSARLVAADGVRAGSIVTPATLERPPDHKEPAPFIPLGMYRTRSVDFNYVEEEWFASGIDDTGRSYKTQVFVRRPRDPARFSGTIIAESLHVGTIAPIMMYCSPYIMRSGHGWACIASQKMPLDSAVKRSDVEHYATLHIEGDGPPTGPPNVEDHAAMVAMWAQMLRVNQASNAILAQAGAALRSQTGPFDGYDVRHVILAGHSQTGFVATNYILSAHESHRLAGGASVYDGYFPTGFPAAPFPARDVPLIQVVSNGDVFDSTDLVGQGFEGRKYRRPDSDEHHDRYRLYELAGMPHMGTRYPPHNNPATWVPRQGGAIKASDTMNSLPHHELFNMALNHLVLWVSKNVTPPRGARLQLASDGRFFAVDEHGNTLGGVRCVQMDVPRATYHADPLNAQGAPIFSTTGTETPFSPEQMKKLYVTSSRYVDRFDHRLDELIKQGWFLAEDAPDMRAEARSQTF